MVQMKIRRMTNERLIVLGSPRRKLATRRMLICGNCGAEFMPSRSDAKWCSRSGQAHARVTGQKRITDSRAAQRKA
jgi:hypothetical protein